MNLSKGKIVVELSEEEAALTRQAIQAFSSDIYQSASGEEFEDEAYERERQEMAERRMRDLALLGRKFTASND